MGDPFSLASSAMGVISLGLSVCQGLDSYYASYKSYSQETQAASCQVQNLGEILQLIKKRLADIQELDGSLQPECGIAARTIEQCKPNIEKLEEILQDCQKDSPVRRIQKVAQKLDHIIFPLRRATLDRLLATMDKFQGQLNFVLQALNMAISVVIGRNLALLLSNSRSSASDNGEVLNLVQGLGNQQELSNGKIGMIEDRLADMEIDIIRHGQTPIRQPALLRSLLDKQQYVDEDTDTLVDEKVEIPVATVKNRCTCPDSDRSTSIWNGFKTGGSQFARCSRHSSSKNLVSLQIRRTFFNAFLKFSVKASLEVTRGAGGFSISPNLVFRPVVPEDSPAFLLLKNTEKKSQFAYSDIVLQDTVKNLSLLFQQGKASPFDTLPDGTTLLHVVASWSWAFNESDTSRKKGSRTFINNLLQLGLQPHVVDDYGHSPADRFVQIPEFLNNPLTHSYPPAIMEIFSDMLRASNQTIFEGFQSRYLHDVVSAFCLVKTLLDYSQRYSPEGIDIPDELAPLIYKSKPALRQALRENVDLQGVMLHYVHWPEGLSLLLQAGYVPDADMLEFAIDMEVPESVKILVEPNIFPLTSAHFERASIGGNQEIMENLVLALASRRRRLQTLVETHLTSKELSQLHVRPDCLIGYNAPEAYRRLQARFVELDHPAESAEWLVYSSIGGNLHMADMLWDAGFRDVDEVDCNNRTSLICIYIAPERPEELLRKAEWLVNKGADIYRQINGSSVLYFLSHNFGSWVTKRGLVHHDPGVCEMEEECRSLIRLILFSDFQDSCFCPCSPRGCSTLSLFLKGLLSSHDLWTTLFDLRRLRTLVQHLEPVSPGSLFDRLAPDVLRLITFHQLGITHTCICGDSQVDPDDIEDIQDDQRGQIFEFENILAELLSEYEEQAISLPDFIAGYWKSRMSDILTSGEAPSQEEIRRARGIGVVLYEESSST